MKSEQYVVDDFDEFDALDFEDENTPEEDTQTDDEQVSSDENENQSETEERFANSSNENETAQDDAKSEPEPEPEPIVEDKTEETKSDDTDTVKGKEDLLTNILEKGDEAIERIVEQKLNERLEADKQKDLEVKESQDRFVKQANELKAEVQDFEKVVNDDLFKEIMKEPDIAIQIFDNKDNAKMAYVYAQTGVVFTKPEVLEKQYQALKSLNPIQKESATNKVPPVSSGGAFGVGESAYDDPDLVGWDD